MQEQQSKTSEQSDVAFSLVFTLLCSYIISRVSEQSYMFYDYTFNEYDLKCYFEEAFVNRIQILGLYR